MHGILNAPYPFSQFICTLDAKSIVLLFQAASRWLHIVPWGIRKLVKYVKRKYGNTPIIITENGE